VAKMEARVGGGGAFAGLLPVSLEVRSRNRGGLGRLNVGGWQRVEINCLV